MATRERPADRGRRRATDALERLGREHRQARIGAGLSLRAVGDATGTSHQLVLRFERGALHRPLIDDVGAWCEVVGLELRFVPIRPAIRFVTQVSSPAGTPSSSAAPVARVADRSPAADRGRPSRVGCGHLRSRWHVVVEAETVLRDAQALERRLNVKRRDGRAGEVLLVIADTAANRVAFAAASGSFPGFDRSSLDVCSRHFGPATTRAAMPFCCSDRSRRWSDWLDQATADRSRQRTFRLLSLRLVHVLHQRSAEGRILRALRVGRHLVHRLDHGPIL